MLLLKSLQRISVTLLTRNSSPSLLGLCGLLLLSRFSHVRLCATPWTAAYQAPPFMRFSRQEYWSGEPLPSPIYSLNNFQIHHAAVLTSRCVMHHVSSTYLSHSWELVPFGHLHSVPHPPLCVSSDLFS